MFFFKNLLSFLAYLVTPPNKASGPMPNRWFVLSLIAAVLVMGLGMPIYFYAYKNNYKDYAAKTLHQKSEALHFTHTQFSSSVSHCRQGYKRIRIYCGASIVSQGKGLDHDYARQRAQDNGWQLITANTGTPDTGWLRYAYYTKEKRCLTLREVDGPTTTQVTIALDNDCGV